MKHFETTTTINASPERVWEILADTGSWSDWDSGVLGLFKGVRRYTLTPEGEGRTRFEMREEFTGPLLPLIWRTMPDLSDSFRQFANGLKERAEGS